MIHAVESEQAVIGAVLYDAAACAEAVERLRPEHFYDPTHAALWTRISEAMRRHCAPDPAVLMAQMQDHEGLGQLGGLRFLSELVQHANTYTLPAHVELILDRSSRRLIRQLANHAASQAERVTEGTAEEILAEMERGAADIAREGVSASIMAPAGLDALDMIEAAWRGENLGTPTGLSVLDNITGGIRQEDVWIIGARTSMGKSVMGLCLGRALAQQSRGVAIFSLEMPRREVQARLVADLCYEPGAHDNLRYSDLLKGRGTPPQHRRAIDAARALASLPIAIADAGGLTIDDIRSQALRQVRAWERAGVRPGCILIDHIGLVRPTRKTDNKAADTSDTVNELKALAKAVKAPVIALSQINRGPENRQDKRPTVSDLNWSGAIEQIADFICLLYRESYYLERSSSDVDRVDAKDRRHELELLIGKNRSGPICNLNAFVDVACNVVRDPQQPASARTYA